MRNYGFMDQAVEYGFTGETLIFIKGVVLLTRVGLVWP